VSFTKEKKPQTEVEEFVYV